MSRGYEDWVKLTSDGKHFIEMVLAFSAPSDGIVTEKLVSRIMVKIQSSEIRAFYSLQNFMENEHSETYSAYIKDSDEKYRMLSAIQCSRV